MATAFDGLGMSHLGKERQYMSGGPISEIAKMIPAGLLGYGLYKSGAVENLNDMFNPKKMLTDKISGAIAPDKGYAIGDPSETGFNPAKDTLNNKYVPTGQAVSPTGVPPSQSAPAAPIDDNDNLLNEIIPLRTGAPLSIGAISADPLKLRDPVQDLSVMQAQAVAPPPKVGQEQMGKNSGGDGDLVAAIAPQLIKMFFGLG
jgi:hypothetical protein